MVSKDLNSIIDQFQIKGKTMDLGVMVKNEQFWSNFYSQNSLRHDPSPFAVWCLENHFQVSNRVLELGCGNARDTLAFLHKGLSVVAIDGCEVAVKDNIEHLVEAKPKGIGEFFSINFSDIARLREICPKSLRSINTIYSRFVLHAIPEEIEDVLLNFCASILPKGGKMFHEFRTIHDPLMLKGKVISANERLTDHYRRFIDVDTIRKKLIGYGFQESYFIEDRGLAKFGNDDPVVARIVHEKI